MTNPNSLGSNTYIDEIFKAANLCVANGNFERALTLYHDILSQHPENPRALHALGVVCYRNGDCENGIQLVRNSLEIQPEYTDALLNLGKMLHEQGSFLEATDCYRRVADIKIDDQNALFLMAMLLYKTEKHEQAIAAYQKLLAIAPDHLDATLNLGQILLEALRVDDAEALLRHAYKLAPDNAGVLIALGNVALSRGDMADAEKYYLAACTTDPRNAEAHTNLGHLHTDQHIEKAIYYCRTAVKLKPDLAVAWVNLGVALERGLQHSEAISAYRTALMLNPKLSGAHSNLLMLMNYMPEYSQSDIFTESTTWNNSHAIDLNSRWKHDNSNERSEKKIRVGFVSADFKFHPVSYHFLPVIENYGRNTFEFFCYNNANTFDEMSSRIQERAACWRDIYDLSDDVAAELIRHDEVDILIDLSGHTAGNRLLLFARKPAPIQASWLGYFNTTGLTAIDYLISDATTIPVTEEVYFSEKIMKLPITRFCYAPPLEAPPLDDLLTEHSGKRITFASFNNAAKITHECVSLWASVLTMLPDSKLILKWASYLDDGVKNRIISMFAKYGVVLEQLEFCGMSPRAEMLAQYSDIDMCLDTYPFCGGATTCDALWMGVPVITLSGSTPISRQSSSFLTCIGHSELIADSPDSYLQIVKSLASDNVRRATLRRTLRLDMASSLLCDGETFTRNLEMLFRKMINEKYIQATNNKELQNPKYNENFMNGLDFLSSKDFVSAAECFELVLSEYPENAQAHNNLGIAYFEIGFRDDAKSEFITATKISPHNADAWKNLGKAIRDTGGNPEIAARCFRKAISIAPDFDDAWMMLGTTLLDRGRSSESITCFRKSLQLNPDNCDAHSNLLFAMNYISTISQSDICKESLKWNKIHTSDITPIQHRIRTNLHRGARLRIGYVSGDFKRHPVGYHLLPVIATHDRERFEVYCYATMREQDDLTEKLQKHVAGWREISLLSDNDAATLICDDKIDILVDLAGHTKGSRLLLFAHKPAPVQVSWLGYFNTTGVKAIDFLISDETTISPEDEQCFSEKIVRLPGSRFCYSPPEYAPLVHEPPVLKNGMITFGSFNNIAKLTSEVIALWSKVLIAVPDSRLIIKWSSLGRKKERDWLIKQFARHGVDSNRLILRSQSSHTDMLKEYGDIDIALDPFPFSGGMTSCEALWMGVPVLTLLGDKPAGRQTASFLKTIGLPDWITISQEQFILRSQAVASDHEQLRSLRFELRERMTNSTLCNGVSFTRKLEKLYCQLMRDQTSLHKN